MYEVNRDHLKLKTNYLFSEVAKKVAEFQMKNPDRKIIRLGIGDVTQPLVPAVIGALHAAVDEMAEPDTFRGYAPESGYDFLKNAIAKNDYKEWGCEIYPDEIFISDGAKSDAGNIQEIFSKDCKVAICDPVYPVYIDTNIMAGRAGSYDCMKKRWSEVIYMPCTKENHFVPDVPKRIPDIIYLCFPNNPTGETMTKQELQGWVDFANKTGAVIIYDAAYEAYITQDNVPHSIFECQGARTCAVELRSFSKKAGFTGLRLGAAIIPKDLRRGGTTLHSLWKRRQGTKYNGTPYIVQRAGEAVYSEEGSGQIREQISYYQRNAGLILKTLKEEGYEVAGGVNSPYIWWKTPGKTGSWEFFDHLLEKTGVVGTPGAGFGPAGEGYFRLTAFGTYENTLQAMERIRTL